MDSAMHPTQAIKPQLTTTDWNEEWKHLQRARSKYDDPAGWDARAKTFSKKHGDQNPYADCFIEKMQLLPKDTVFDMGCGNGALALPLAEMGHSVVACDFSKGMLEVLERDKLEYSIDNIKTIQMSWEDNWADFGVEPKSADIAIASRSICTADIGESLSKLDSVARRRCCITLPCGPSPKVDASLLKAAGLEPRLGNDFLYAFNILAAMGRLPEISYISSAREENFSSLEEALDYYSSAVEGSVYGMITQEQAEAIFGSLKHWLKEKLVEDSKGFHLPKPRQVAWAFIAWNPNSIYE